MKFTMLDIGDQEPLMGWAILYPNIDRINVN